MAAVAGAYAPDGALLDRCRTKLHRVAREEDHLGPTMGSKRVTSQNGVQKMPDHIREKIGARIAWTSKLVAGREAC